MAMDQPTPDCAVDGLPAFAACFRLCATLLRYPDLHVTAALTKTLPHFDQVIEAFTAPFPPLPELETLQLSYTSLFVANPAGIPAIPYLSCRLEPEGQTYGAATAEMRRLMAQEGVQVDPGVGEPEDHIALVLDFAAFLAERSMQDPVKQDTLRRLTQEYLFPFFISGFAADVATAEPGGFYAHATAFCQALIEEYRFKYC